MNSIPKEYTSNTIYNYLKGALLSGTYVPGDQITEIKIASQFGTSRTPVREAFRKLSEDGLLYINPNKSVEAVTYDKKTIGQLGIMRLQFDILSAKLAIHYGSNSDFLKMKDLATQCCKAESKGEHIKAIGLDADFHISLAKTSKNTFLHDMQSAIWLRTQYILVNEEENFIGYDQRITLHFNIVDALMERNEEKTLSIIKEHILARYALTEDLPPGFIDNL
ncbi:MAG TPA: GntR family transcriptional regulator [Anaerovoracaceae bacterium]|nr:GntR family transcriptional regulator [Anaerovoracaceae bacterium]